VIGSEFALDTNLAIAILNQDGHSEQWLSKSDTIFLPIPVIGELRFGALKSNRVTENQKRIEKLVVACHVLPIDLDTSDVYARIRYELRKRGTPIPANDLWIAAICVQHNIPIVTADGHFDLVPGLVIRRDNTPDRPPPHP
jgi:tRNA(fMet)-specific endonuclease VapC